MLSVADCKELLFKMARLDSFVDTTDPSAMMWELILRDVPDLATAQEAMIRAYQNERKRDVDPHMLLQYVGDVIQERNREIEDERRHQVDRAVARIALARLGRTPAEAKADGTLRAQVEEYVEGTHEHRGHWSELMDEAEKEVAAPALLALPISEPSVEDWMHTRS